MANVLVQDSSLQSIANAIRAKNGTQNTYKPSQMADAITNLPSGGITPTGTINITANGTHDVTNYASAEVNVPTGSEPSLGTKSITANGTYTASDDGIDGYSEVTVNVPTGTTPTGTKQISITQNGTTIEDVSAYANAEITVNVPVPSGTVFSALEYPVTIETTRSGSVAIMRAMYSDSTVLSFARSNVTSSAPITITDMLTDGTHIFVNAAAGTTFSYNGETATFVKYGTNYMITIPDGFDGTIPFVLA